MGLSKSFRNNAIYSAFRSNKYVVVSKWGRQLIKNLPQLNSEEHKPHVVQFKVKRYAKWLIKYWTFCNFTWGVSPRERNAVIFGSVSSLPYSISEGF
jgi:hypothetical protein